MPEPIEVTDCRVYLNPHRDTRVKAFVSIALNQVFVVCDLKIIQGKKDLFVAMPSRRRTDGIFHDVAHPIEQPLRDHIESVALSQYHEVLATQNGELATSLATSPI